MQEADEQDTCRICSAPAEQDQPLFHPCKCSGTIRYIHQDCLTTWLAHSRKKTCDVCKHPYAFTKVYDPNMPSHLPPLLLLRRLIQQFLMAVFFVFRVIGVAIIWLAVLPYITVWTWRAYFSMGETTAWWISNRPRVNHNDTVSLFPKAYEGNPILYISNHAAWSSISTDILAGQLIAAMIVLIFVSVFLLREWIGQNARPGLFEEEDFVPPEEPPPPAPPEPVPARLPHAARFQGFPDAEAFARRQEAALRALEALRRPEAQRTPDPQPHVINEQVFIDRMETAQYKRRMKAIRTLAAKRRARAREAPVSPSPVIEPGTTATPEAETPGWLSQPTSPEGQSQGKDSPFFPPVRLERPNQEIPFAIHRRHAPLDETPGPSRRQATIKRKRPTLPVSTLAMANAEYEDRRHSFTISPGRSPMTSPGLATYHPPEELLDASVVAPGSSMDESPKSYFDALAESDSADNRRREWNGEWDDGSGRDSEQEENDAEFWSTVPRIIVGIDGGNEAVETVTATDGINDALISGTNDGAGSEASGGENRAARIIGNYSTNSEEEEETEEDEEEDDQPRFDAHLLHRQVPAGNGDMVDLIDQEFQDEEDEDDEDDAELFFRDANEQERVLIEPVAVLLDGPADLQPPNFNVGNANVNGAGQAALGAGQNPANGAAPALNGAGEDQGFDPNDDIDGNVEDDMDGALEAVGIRGPIFGVFQNAALMIFVLDTAIGLCIWIPFTVGKTTALLALDPYRFLQLLHLPIKAMRFATDPVVDSIAYILTQFVIPPWLRLVRESLALIVAVAGKLSRAIIGSKTTDNVHELSSQAARRIFSYIDHSPLAFWSSSSPHIPQVEVPVPEPEHLFPEYARFLEPFFAALGKEVRVSSALFKEAWIERAEGNDTLDKVFAVCLGYLVFAVLVALYLNILTVGNARTAGRAVRNVIRQQLLVVKVAGFIFIELVIFPLGCGVVLDVCTVWLFPETNIQSRLAFLFQAPLTSLFYHWIAGTLFMYSFAILLSGCRSIMRPGAMWFVKDPEDRNAHPIRDILERHTLTQLRKIIVSGLMYAVVVACVVGSIAGLLVIGKRSILPFRWKNREPLSKVPIDLLFLHLVLPQSMHHFRPRRFVRNVTGRLWKRLARWFRLTSYFFGGRHPAEEVTWRITKSGAAKQKHDGSFRRVPATDQIALPRDIRATARVHEDGTPYDDEAASLLAIQNQEAEKAKHDPAKDYMIVYIPPLFRYRLIGFISVMWMACAVLLGAAVAIPIQLGRMTFATFGHRREVHDGYSLIVGFYMLWACYLVGKSVDRLDKRRQRVRVDDGPEKTADLRWFVFKRGLLWVAKSVYMSLALGVVVPILLGIVVDLYIVYPARMLMAPAGKPLGLHKVRLVDAWALGLIYGKIALHATNLQPPNDVTRGLHHILSNGWVRLNPVTATVEVIGPLVVGLLGMILGPALLVQPVWYFLPAVAMRKNFSAMILYPAICGTFAIVRVTVDAYEVLSTWAQSVRDTEFLVELRLRNHEPSIEQLTIPAAAKHDTGREELAPAPELDQGDPRHLDGDDAILLDDPREPGVVG